MAANNFARCLALTLRYEGGYVDHPSDPGGATNMGITRATLARVRGKPVSKAQVRALTRDEAAKIYRTLYWDAVRGDDMPAGVDCALFDLAVNAGPARAARILHAQLGLSGARIVAGSVAATQRRESEALARAICQARAAWLKRLKTFSVFGRGWLRRVAAIEAAACAQAASSRAIAHAAAPDKRASVQASVQASTQAGVSPVTKTAFQKQPAATMRFALDPAPAAPATEPAKPFWASQTIWSSIAVVGSSVAGALLAWKSGDMAAFGAALTALLGGVNAIVGRVRANAPIG